MRDSAQAVVRAALNFGIESCATRGPRMWQKMGVKGACWKSELTIDMLNGDQISISVTNTGKRAGQEVVQLYVSDSKASVVRPKKELKGFIKLKIGDDSFNHRRFRLLYQLEYLLDILFSK